MSSYLRALLLGCLRTWICLLEIYGEVLYSDTDVQTCRNDVFPAQDGEMVDLVFSFCFAVVRVLSDIFAQAPGDVPTFLAKVMVDRHGARSACNGSLTELIIAARLRDAFGRRITFARGELFQQSELALFYSRFSC